MNSSLKPLPPCTCETVATPVSLGSNPNNQRATEHRPAAASDSNGEQQQPTRFSIFQGRFILDHILGRGGFGEVYRGIQANTRELVAVKLERRSQSEHSFLFHEACVMQNVQRNPSSDGHPPIGVLKYFGQEGDYRMLIMALHGPSLEDIHEKIGRFSLRTTLMIADQMLSRLEYVHTAGYLHRDLKPDNFLLGIDDPRRIYLIDFGLATRYLTSEGSHRPQLTGKSFVGTSRYASSRTHQGYSQSRRDDIEQLVYVMIYMHLGCLPWSGLRIRDRDEKERRIGEMKAMKSPEEICAGCPSRFVDLLYYARNMVFEEAPAYNMVHTLLQTIMKDIPTPALTKMDNVFDWEPGAPPPCLSNLPAHLLVPVVPSPLVDAWVPPSMQNENNTNNNVNKTNRPVRRNNRRAENEDQQRRVDSPFMLSSNAQGQGIFSGFGSGGLSQDIVSLGEKN